MTRTSNVLPSLILATLAGAFTLPAAADVTVTPMASYRTGTAEFPTGVVCAASIDFPCPSLGESDDAPAFGLIADFDFSENWAIELLVNRQSTEIVVEMPICPACLVLAVPPQDFDLTTVHLGLKRQWQAGRVQPFAALGAGITQLRSHETADGPDYFDFDEEGFSASVAAGLEVPLTSLLGLRFEGRAYWLELPEDISFDDDLVQTEIGAGLSFRF